MTTNHKSNGVKPRLIYDGDCGFCVYSINYWHKLTGSSVEYKPYQEVADQYKDISTAEFQRAIVYVAPDGKTSKAAEAGFLTLSHAPYKSYWLWLYRHVPGFAMLAEFIYSFISTHRSFAFRACKILWGSDYTPPTYNIATWMFIRALSIIFLFAFYSFSMQANGLIGSDGIVPVSELVNAATERIGIERFWYIPMVFWISSSDIMIHLVCAGGMIFSLLLLFNIYPRFSLFMLYILYLSLIYAGQVFMSFQWDLLLIEVSLIAIVLLSARVLGIWLLRWLLFRFMFAAGLVKIFSGDNSWLDYTALYYHFFTQPLPTPVAWYAQQLPEIVLRSATILTLVIELFIAFFIFAPRRLRFFAGFMILSLQFAILITGNYNFFNITTIILCFALYDDAALRKLIPSSLSNMIMRHYVEGKHYLFTTILATVFAVITITISILQLGLRFNNDMPAFTASINNSIAPLRMVSTYGPFAVMTKTRPEIIIQGSNDGVFWYTYEFKYKPGDINRPLRWNFPFQPRLDWQMWFAALSEPENNPWIYHFIKRLLENSPSVTALLEYNPFSTTGVTFIRAQFYDYKFTTFKERWETSDIWKREYIKDYLPSIRLNPNGLN